MLDWCENPAVSLRTNHAIDHLAAARRLELHAFATLLVAVRVILVSHGGLGDLDHGSRAG
jgi:hypothetical protein